MVNQIAINNNNHNNNSKTNYKEKQSLEVWLYTSGPWYCLIALTTNLFSPYIIADPWAVRWVLRSGAAKACFSWPDELPLDHRGWISYWWIRDREGRVAKVPFTHHADFLGAITHHGENWIGHHASFKWGAIAVSLHGNISTLNELALINCFQGSFQGSTNLRSGSDM